MQELVGHSAKLEFNRDGKRLFFSAKTISSITDTHITFVDKFNDVYTFRLIDLVEANDVQ